MTPMTRALDDIEIKIHPPIGWSADEKRVFADLVRAGGNVTSDGLEERIESAKYLAFAKRENEIIGIAALKSLPNYRDSVFERAGVADQSSLYPYELGWIYVVPWSRGYGIAQKIAKSLLTKQLHGGIYATSRLNDAVTRALYERLGLKKLGTPYSSTRGNYQLNLFVSR